MITLITGVPGTGKTALCISMLMAEWADRPLLADGIKDFTLAHAAAPPIAEWTERVPDASSQDGYKLQFTFAATTVVVIDEAQRIFRVRPQGSPVPPYVAAFETHRHQGLDFCLITQHPNLIDANVRKLVGRHIHIRSGLMGRFLYEWSEVGDVENRASRELSAKRRYKLPKQVFERYSSAEVHTKVRRRTPMYAYIAIAAGLSFFATAGYVYFSLKSRMSTPAVDAAVGKPGAPGAPGVAQAAPPGPDYFQGQVARVPGLAHTAAVYDPITAPKAAPFPSACAASAARCDCFTDQATHLEMEESMCRAIVARGLYKPWAELPAAPGAPAPAVAPAPPGAVPAASVPPVTQPVAEVAIIESAMRGGSHIRGATAASAGAVGALPAATAPGASIVKR